MRSSVSIPIILGVALLATGLILGTVVVLANGGFAFLQTSPEMHTYTIDETFSHVILRDISADIQVDYATNHRCEVHLSTYAYSEFSINAADNTLTIEETNTAPWYTRIGVFSSAPTITVYLPQKEYQTLHISGTTGDITVPPSLSFDSATIDITTGDISFSASVKDSLGIDVTTGDILVGSSAPRAAHISTTTGTITLNNIQPAELQLQSNTGDIRATNVSCDSLLAQSTTGDMTFENTLVSGKSSLKSTTGDITLTACDSGEYTITTTTGDVYGALLNDMCFFAETSTGNVALPKTMQGGPCYIVTTTGDISFTILPDQLLR